MQQQQEGNVVRWLNCSDKTQVGLAVNVVTRQFTYVAKVRIKKENVKLPQDPKPEDGWHTPSQPEAGFSSLAEAAGALAQAPGVTCSAKQLLDELKAQEELLDMDLLLAAAAAAAAGAPQGQQGAANRGQQGQKRAAEAAAAGAGSTAASALDEAPKSPKVAQGHHPRRSPAPPHNTQGRSATSSHDSPPAGRLHHSAGWQQGGAPSPLGPQGGHQGAPMSSPGQAQVHRAPYHVSPGRFHAEPGAGVRGSGRQRQQHTQGKHRNSLAHCLSHQHDQINTAMRASPAAASAHGREARTPPPPGSSAAAAAGSPRTPRNSQGAAELSEGLTDLGLEEAHAKVAEGEARGAASGRGPSRGKARAAAAAAAASPAASPAPGSSAADERAGDDLVARYGQLMRLKPAHLVDTQRHVFGQLPQGLDRAVRDYLAAEKPALPKLKVEFVEDEFSFGNVVSTSALFAERKVGVLSLMGSVHFPGNGVYDFVPLRLEVEPLQAEGGAGGVTRARLAANSPAQPEMPQSFVIKAQLRGFVMRVPVGDLTAAINGFLPEFGALSLGGIEDRHILQPLAFGVAFAAVDTSKPHLADMAEKAAAASAQRIKQLANKECATYIPPGRNATATAPSSSSSPPCSTRVGSQPSGNSAGDEVMYVAAFPSVLLPRMETDLYAVLQQPQHLYGCMPSAATHIARSTLLGLGPLHKFGILHKDLKPSNLLCSVAEGAAECLRGRDGPTPAALHAPILALEVKLADTGTSSHKGLAAKDTNFACTRLYADPALLDARDKEQAAGNAWLRGMVVSEAQHSVPKQTDIWGVGLLWAMARFGLSLGERLVQQHRNNLPAVLIESARLPGAVLGGPLTPEEEEFAWATLQPDATLRPDVDGVLKLPLMTSAAGTYELLYKDLAHCKWALQQHDEEAAACRQRFETQRQEAAAAQQQGQQQQQNAMFAQQQQMGALQLQAGTHQLQGMALQQQIAGVQQQVAGPQQQHMEAQQHNGAPLHHQLLPLQAPAVIAPHQQGLQRQGQGQQVLPGFGHQEQPGGMVGCGVSAGVQQAGDCARGHQGLQGRGPGAQAVGHMQHWEPQGAQQQQFAAQQQGNAPNQFLPLPAPALTTLGLQGLQQQGQEQQVLPGFGRQEQPGGAGMSGASAQGLQQKEGGDGAGGRQELQAWGPGAQAVGHMHHWAPQQQQLQGLVADCPVSQQQQQQQPAPLLLPLLTECGPQFELGSSGSCGTCLPVGPQDSKALGTAAPQPGLSAGALQHQQQQQQPRGVFAQEPGEQEREVWQMWQLPDLPGMAAVYRGLQDGPQAPKPNVQQQQQAAGTGGSTFPGFASCLPEPLEQGEVWEEEGYEGGPEAAAAAGLDGQEEEEEGEDALLPVQQQVDSETEFAQFLDEALFGGSLLG